MISEACRLESIHQGPVRCLLVVTGAWWLKSIVVERSKFVWARVILMERDWLMGTATPTLELINRDSDRVQHT